MHLILQGLAQTAVGGKEGFVAVNPAFNNFSDANNRIVVHVLAQAATQLVAEGLLVTSVIKPGAAGGSGNLLLKKVLTLSLCI